MPGVSFSFSGGRVSAPRWLVELDGGGWGCETPHPSPTGTTAPGHLIAKAGAVPKKIISKMQFPAF